MLSRTTGIRAARRIVAGKTWQIVVLVHSGSSSRNNRTVERCSIRFRGSKRTIERGFAVSLPVSKIICASGTRVRMPSRELLVKFDGLAL